MDQKIILLKINGIEYKVKTTISISLLRMSEENSEEAFEKRVAEVISFAIIIENIEDKPSIEKIFVDGNYVFQKYIDAVVSCNEEYSYFYSKRPETESICERFCKALDEYRRGLMAEFSKEVSIVFAQAYQPLTKLFNSIGEMTNRIIVSINQSFAPVLEGFVKIQENISRELGKVAKVWNEFDWEALEVNYRKWGEFGWTFIDNVPLALFAKWPESQIEADKQALQFFNKNEMEKLFDDLRKLHTNRKDIESAVFCFNNKQYKASAMLLCAMIESPFIKIQQIDQKRRKVGKNAVKKFSDKCAGTLSLENKRFLYLYSVNVFSFLTMLFDDAEDFKSEPKQLNRNFINHGMEKRDVRRKDCVKLFLGLYNTIEMINMMNIKSLNALYKNN